jgi:simple sugar transport system permease protein
MDTLLVSLLAATLRMSTTLVYGTLGELFCERAGIMNLGNEGTMFFGAFVGFAVAKKTGSLPAGLVAAILAGILAGLLMALLTVQLGVSQHVSGLGTTLILIALSLFIFRLYFGNIAGVSSQITPFAELNPFGNIPILGQIFQQYLLTYVAFLLVPVVWWVFKRTRFGLHIRAVGENPEAADAAGLNVYRLRTIALMIGGALMAVGGAFLSLAQLGSFSPGIINGRGWVSVALVIFANWESFKVMGGALIFGGVNALQLRLQTTSLNLPYELFLALPYIVTILALVLFGRNVTGPAAILKPYKRE